MYGGLHFPSHQPLGQGRVTGDGQGMRVETELALAWTTSTVVLLPCPPQRSWRPLWRGKSPGWRQREALGPSLQQTAQARNESRTGLLISALPGLMDTALDRMQHWQDI